VCQKGFVCYDPILHRTRISRNVIFFENQHFFHVSSLPSSSTVVLSSFEERLSDLPPVSSRFKPGIVYTRRSRSQSLPVAHSVSDPTTLQIQSVAAPPMPLVRRSSRVSVPPDRYGFSSSSGGNSISALTASLLHWPILIFPTVTHMLPSMIVGDMLCRKILPL
jgi:hypothetical protein